MLRRLSRRSAAPSPVAWAIGMAGACHRIGRATRALAFLALASLELVVVSSCTRDTGLRDPAKRATASGIFFVESAPFLEFGRAGTGENGDFERVSGGVRLSTGEIVIVDSRENRVRYFDRKGKVVRSFGRTGGGPNGFRAAAWIGRCGGDSVFVWDPLDQRVVVISPTASLVRAYRQPENAAVMRCSPDAVFAILGAPAKVEKPPITGISPRQMVALDVADANGGLIRPLARVRFPENRPLGRGTFFDIVGDRVYVGTADSGFIDAYSLDGVRLQPLHVSSPRPRGPTRRNYDRALDELVAGLPIREDREAARRYLARIPLPKVLPPYSGVFGSLDGTLWIGTSVPGDSETVLHAVSPSGGPLGEVHLPVYVKVLEIGPNYILGAYRTRNGEDRVILYRFGRYRSTQATSSGALAPNVGR